MFVLFYLALFFGGAFLANGVPHFVNGISGRRFPTPFAKPPGKGESTSGVNILWAFLNFFIAYLLLWSYAHFDYRFMEQFIAVWAGALLTTGWLAHHFGSIYGGNK
jgi:hypothetical protein